MRAHFAVGLLVSAALAAGCSSADSGSGSGTDGGSGAGSGGQAAFCDNPQGCFETCLCQLITAEECVAACGTGGTGNVGNTGGTGNAGNTGGAGNVGNTGGTGNVGNTGGTGNVGNTGGSGNAGGSTGACADDGTGWNSAWQTFECQVLDLTNQRRAQGASCGGTPYPPVGPVSKHPQLTTSARLHAKDMGDNNFFDHVNLQGLDPFDRMKNAGFTGTTMGENIAAGQSTPAAVVQGWMQSTGHCKNIMNGKYKYLGVGYYYAPGSKYKHYWVQNFGG